ncbi:hypothetical protein [Pantoea sp. RHCKP32]|uniref:hypothetical protein n=1 Tax=Pantoea sp. RHCKP32 TaxID=3425182 RepID=UPI003DA19560
MTIKYKVRDIDSIKKGNDVICFDYINELTNDYKATSLEINASDRNDGYFQIFSDMLKWLGYSSEKNYSIFMVN